MARSIERAHRPDARALAELHVATVTVAYVDIFPADSSPPTVDEMEAAYDDLLARSDAAVFVHRTPDAVAGAIVLVADPAVPSGHRIERFNVRPEVQGQGLGRSLYDRALAHAGQLGLNTLELWVLEDNDRARAIYESWGWTLVPGWLLPNEPPEILDVLYRLDLSPTAPDLK